MPSPHHAFSPGRGFAKFTTQSGRGSQIERGREFCLRRFLESLGNILPGLGCAAGGRNEGEIGAQIVRAQMNAQMCRIFMAARGQFAGEIIVRRPGGHGLGVAQDEKALQGFQATW